MKHQSPLTRRLLPASVLALAGLGLTMVGWSVAPTVRTSTQARLVIAGLQKSVADNARSTIVQLKVGSSDPVAQPQYHALNVYFAPRIFTTVDLSPNGRWLSYVDPTFHVHLVRLSTGLDRALGKGFSPHFSTDNRFLAYLSGEGYPIGTPGIQGFLKVYDIANSATRTVGKGGRGPLYSDYAWSPTGHELTWQINLLKGGAHQKRPNPNGPLWVGYASANSPQHVSITRPPGKRGDIFPRKRAGRVPAATELIGDEGTACTPGGNQVPDVRSDGGFAWDGNNRSLLYWRWKKFLDGGATNQWALVRWTLPNGPAHTVATFNTSFPKDESYVPAPVISKSGRVVASLLGGPLCRVNRLKLYFASTRRVPTISLGGRVQAARFNPSGKKLSVVWEVRESNSKRYGLRVAVVDVATLSHHNVGPGLAGFWVRP